MTLTRRRKTSLILALAKWPATHTTALMRAKTDVSSVALCSRDKRPRVFRFLVDIFPGAYIGIP
jgi:hypothetical protein